MGEALPSRFDYGIFLDCDPSGALSRNLLEYFQDIVLLSIELLRIREPYFQNLLDDTVYNSLLVVWTLL